MFRKSLICLFIFAFAGGAIGFAADGAATADEIAELKDQIKDLEKRVMKNERKSALDRINFTGDFRFEANSISTSTPDHFNGMQLQNLMVNTMFWMGATGSMMPPADISEIDAFIAQNYAQYLYFTDNLTFDWLKDQVGMFPPEQMQGLMQYLMPNTYTPATTSTTHCSIPAACASTSMPTSTTTSALPVDFPCTKHGATPPVSRYSTASPTASTSTATPPVCPTPTSCASSAPTSTGRTSAAPPSTSQSVDDPRPADPHSTTARVSPARAPRWEPDRLPVRRNHLRLAYQ